MRRVLVFLMLLPLLLTACGGGDTTVADPPASQPFAGSESEQVNGLVEDWQRVAWEEMAADGVKPETKEEKIYQSTASLADIEKFYGELTTKGWYRLNRMPGLQGDILLAGYEHGTTALVVGAIDASKHGGEGVIIYTLKGTK
ncbi:MAG: hypothetical protein RLZZ387_5477 [Chloroflexota bacterium]|jgi:hypothetical protein